MSHITVIEQCNVSPPQDDDHEFSLPMVFFDLLWYTFPVNQFLLFFEIPNCSKSNFLETIVPRLKHSLSLTIKHFLPLSGHIVHPLKPVNKPVLRYKPGDSISFTVAESNTADDFNNLIGKQPRVCDDFYCFVPELPSETETEDFVMSPVIALQVTLFPGFGISIGSVTHHAVVDAITITMFLQAWALLTRSWQEPIDSDKTIEARLKEFGCLPCYDRKTVTNIDGLDTFFWDSLASCKPIPRSHVTVPINKSRAIFVLKKEQVQMLKNYVVCKRPDLKRLSSFAVTCGLVWMCASRSEENIEEADQTEVFTFVADCRGRLNPPLPRNYFGNCLALAKAELKHGELIGDNGFVIAVEAISKGVRDWVYGEKGILSKVRDWDDEFVNYLEGKRVYGVAGSPKFDIYNVDFGWGNPKKYEPLFIDNDRSISLCKSLEFEDGIEIGLSRKRTQMDAFVELFNERLQEFTSMKIDG